MTVKFPAFVLAGRLATTWVSLYETTISGVPVNSMVGAFFNGSKPDPLKVTWLLL
jgi:hypothetical protein